MILIAITSLFFILKPWLVNILSNGIFNLDPVSLTSLVLFVLTVFLLIEGIRGFGRE